MKIDPYYAGIDCSFWRQSLCGCSCSQGFCGQGVSNDSGVMENFDFHGFGLYIFGTLGNEANIVMQYYLVPCRLSSDPNIYDLQ